jgi:hypothetical protein
MRVIPPNRNERNDAMRYFRLSLILLMIAPALLAQDFNKLELYGGYSRMREKPNINAFSFTAGGETQTIPALCSAETGEVIGTSSQQLFCKDRNFGGFELGATYNLTRYFGITTNITRHAKKQTFVDDFGGIIQRINVDEHLTSFLAGVQVKDNGGAARFKPFAHALIGTTRYNDRQSQTVTGIPQASYTAKDSTSSLGVKIGGGIDIRVTPAIDLRVIEIDYTPFYAKDRHYGSSSGPFTFDVGGKTADNYTIGFGVVVHPGGR